MSIEAGWLLTLPLLLDPRLYPYIVTLISREISGVATFHGSAAPCAMIGAAISLAAEVDDAPHDTIGRHA